MSVSPKLSSASRPDCAAVCRHSGRERRTLARREEGEDWCEMGRRTTAQWSVSGDFLRQLERFLPSKVDRVGYISENRNTADGSEWRAGERVQGHWW